MEKKKIASLSVAGIAASALILSGCSISSEGSESDSRFVLSSGSAEVVSSATESQVNVSISVSNLSGETARNNANSIQDDLLRILDGMGISKEQVSVDGSDNQPYSGSEDNNYISNRSLNMTVGLDRVSEVTAKLQESGRGAVSVSASTVPVATTSGPAYDKAKSDAFGKAKTAAESSARAAGKEVGSVISITEGSTGMNPYPLMRADASSADGIAVQPGDISTTINLEVKFALR